MKNITRVTHISANKKHFITFFIRNIKKIFERVTAKNIPADFNQRLCLNRFFNFIYFSSRMHLLSNPLQTIKPTSLYIFAPIQMHIILENLIDSFDYLYKSAGAHILYISKYFFSSSIIMIIFLSSC